MSRAPSPAVLVDLCRDDGPGPEARGLLAAMPAADVVGLCDLAGTHHVAGVALPRVLAVRPDVEEIRERGRALRMRSFLFDAQRDDVLAALAEDGVPTLLLKGASIGAHYRSPERRDQVDVDLLVPEDAIDAAISSLSRLGYRSPDAATLAGYRRFHFHVPLIRERGDVVELHWRLNRPGEPFDVDPAELRRSALKRTIGERSVAVPCPAHLVVHVVLQILQEGFARLSRFVDLDRIARHGAPDWNEIVRVARAGGIASATAVSLRVGRLLFDSPVPRAVERSLRPTAFTRFHIGLMRPCPTVLERRLEDEWAATGLFRFWLSDGLRGKRAFLSSLRRQDLEWEARLNKPPVPASLFLRRLAKIPVLQLGLYAEAAGRAIAGDLEPFRFWSAR